MEANIVPPRSNKKGPLSRECFGRFSIFAAKFSNTVAAFISITNVNLNS